MFKCTQVGISKIYTCAKNHLIVKMHACLYFPNKIIKLLCSQIKYKNTHLFSLMVAQNNKLRPPLKLFVVDSNLAECRA
jgi:hypothetical protein